MEGICTEATAPPSLTLMALCAEASAPRTIETVVYLTLHPEDPTWQLAELRHARCRLLYMICDLHHPPEGSTRCKRTMLQTSLLALLPASSPGGSSG